MSSNTLKKKMVDSHLFLMRALLVLFNNTSTLSYLSSTCPGEVATEGNCIKLCSKMGHMPVYRD